MAAGSSHPPGEKMFWASSVKLCIQTKRQPEAGTSDAETGIEVGLEESPGREKRLGKSPPPHPNPDRGIGAQFKRKQRGAWLTQNK